MSNELALYRNLLTEIKGRVRQAQHKAALSANAHMTLMYWDIGRMIAARQEQEGWGASVIPRLAVDLKNELPEEKGFSERNIKRMLRFYREYSELPAKVPQPAALLQDSENQVITIVPQAVAKLETSSSFQAAELVQQAVAQIPWGHNVILIEKGQRPPHPPLVRPPDKSPDGAKLREAGACRTERMRGSQPNGCP